MATADLDPIHPAAREATIVDADFHLSPSMEQLLPYFESGDGKIQDTFANASFPPDGFPPATTHWTAAYATNEGGHGLDTQGHAAGREAVLAAIKEIGVDVPLITPGLNRLPTVQTPRMKNAICRAYNNYVLDAVVDVDDDIYALGMIPQWDPQAAVEELDRIGSERGIAGAYGWFGPFRLFGAPEFDPIYERLVDLDLPLSLHTSAAFWPRYGMLGDSLRTWTEFFGFTSASQAMMNTVNMIMTGVFEKFPGLRVVYQEAGVNWIPFAAYRLDEMYQDHPEDLRFTERMYDLDQDYLERLPSEYLYEHFFFATQPVATPPSPRLHAALLEMCQAERTLVFSSDWPHHTFDAPNWAFTSPAVEDDLRERILHENAKEAFRIS